MLLKVCKIMAERQGFEPWELVRAQRFSRPPRSTTPASLRRLKSQDFSGFSGHHFHDDHLASHLSGYDVILEPFCNAFRKALSTRSAAFTTALGNWRLTVQKQKLFYYCIDAVLLKKSPCLRVTSTGQRNTIIFKKEMECCYEIQKTSDLFYE